MSPTRSGTVVCTDAEELHRVLATWAPTDPFPLLPGPALERCRALYAAQGITALPAVDGGQRAGVVLSAGSRDGLAAGHLLAKATGRPHRHLEVWELPDALEAHRDGLVAVTGLAEELAVLGDWLGAFAPRTGVLAARDLPTLLCLVYRTLTTAALGAGGDFAVADPGAPDAGCADAVRFPELKPLTQRVLRTLAIRAEGRECCAQLPDGIICGRTDPPGGPGPRPLPVLTGGRRAPSCLRGFGCFRTDLADSERLGATDLNASLVFTHSAAAVSLGNNAYPTEVGLGLGFLAGAAVAVIGPVGPVTVPPAAEAEFEAAIDLGLPLGEALEQLNTRVQRRSGELCRFGLLGDPGLILGTPARVPTPLRRRAARLTDLPVEGLLPVDPDQLARLARWNSEVLPRLTRLGWLGVDPDERAAAALRDRIRALTNGQFCAPDGESPALEGELADLQAGMVARLVARVHDSRWQFTGGTLGALRQVAAEPMNCPNCRRDCAVLLDLHHRVESRLRLRSVQCRRCGCLWWSTGEGGDLGWHRRRDVPVHRGTPGILRRRLVNTDRAPVFGALGFAFVAGRAAGLPRGWSAPRTLGALRSSSVEWTVDLSAPSVAADEHPAAFLQLFDGVYSASLLNLVVTG